MNSNNSTNPLAFQYPIPSQNFTSGSSYQEKGEIIKANIYWVFAKSQVLYPSYLISSL